MNKGRIGVGLIGVGRHGLRYAQHIVRDLPTAFLSAACRRHPEQEFTVPGAPPVKVYGEVASLVADPTVDVVIVVTPPILFPEICRLAVQACKPMLIEKPLGITAADARAIVDSACKAAVPLMTAHTLRFDSTIQQMNTLRHDIGRSDRLDLISRIETRKTALDHADGYGRRGAMLEIGVHMLDLVRFMTGDEVCEVRCTMDVRPATRPETAASVRLTTSNGTRCQIEIARVSAGRVGRATWWGSHGRLDVDWGQRRVRFSGGTVAKDFELSPSQTVLATLTAFLQAVSDGSPMPITGEDGYRAVELAEACYKSAELGGAPVTLPIPIYGSATM